MGARCRQQPIQEREYLKTKKTNEIKLNRDFALRRKTIHVHLKFDTGADASGALKNGGVLNMLKEIGIVLNTNDHLRGYTGQQRYAIDHFETKHAPYHTAEVAMAANSTFEWDYYFDIDFAQNRFDISDFSAILPLQNYASAFLGITLSSPDDIFTSAGTVTLDSDGSYVDQIDTIVYESGRGNNLTLKDAIESANKIYEASNTPEQIKGKTASFDIDEKQSEYRPIASLVMANYFFTLKDATGTNPLPSDDVVNYLRLRDVLNSRSLFTTIWQTQMRVQRQQNQMAITPTGVLQLDWLDELQGGIENLNPDRLKLVTLNNAPAANTVNSIATWSRYLQPRG